MNIAFTICSNNYLAQAITLGHSLKRTNDDIHFYIGLIDRIDENLDYSRAHEVATILPIDQVFNEVQLSELVAKYNIIELNTSVKPTYFKYFIKKYPVLSSIYYLDPDVEVYCKFDILEQKLSDSSSLLSPHFLTPIPLDGLLPQENLATNYGMFNLGFFAINPQHAEAHKILDWWEERCMVNCFIDEPQGIFVDQLYMNHIPIFFRDVTILSEKGVNMAPWNLHERRLNEMDNNMFKLDNQENLIFYHFSSYQFSKPDQISKYYNRYNFSDFPMLKTLYAAYHTRVIANGYDEFAKTRCFYIKEIKTSLHRRIINKIKTFF